MHRDPRRDTFDIVLRYRMEELLAEVDDLEERLCRTPDEDMDPFLRAKALAALEGMRGYLAEWLRGETELPTPTV